jgi:hypothetical protein
MLANEKIIVGIVAVVAVIGLFVMMGGVSSNDLTGQAISQMECLHQAEKMYNQRVITKPEYKKAVTECHSMKNVPVREEEKKEEERKEEEKSVPLPPPPQVPVSAKSTLPSSISTATTGPYYERDVCVGHTSLNECVGQIFVLSTGVQVEILYVSTFADLISFQDVATGITYSGFSYVDKVETNFRIPTLGDFSLVINEASYEIEFIDLTITCIDWDENLDYETASYITNPVMFSREDDICTSGTMLKEMRCPYPNEPVLSAFQIEDCSLHGMVCDAGACVQVLPDLVPHSASAVATSGSVVVDPNGNVVLTSSGQIISLSYFYFDLSCAIENSGVDIALGTSVNQCRFANSVGNPLSVPFSAPISLNLAVGDVLSWSGSLGLYSPTSSTMLISFLEEVYATGFGTLYVNVDVDNHPQQNIDENDETNNNDNIAVVVDGSAITFEVTECTVNADCGSLEICNSVYQCETVECLTNTDCASTCYCGGNYACLEDIDTVLYTTETGYDVVSTETYLCGETP